MANITTEQRLIDSTNRCLIKLTGIMDGSGQVTPNVAIDVSTLAYAANANGLVMVSNTHPKGSYDVSIRKIWADVSMSAGNAYVKLDWQGAVSNSTIITLGDGYKEINFEGTGGLIGNPLSANTANTTGDIVLSTIGGVANCAYTIILDLKKNQRDFINAFPGA